MTMKLPESHDEIVDLLRSHKPQVEVPAGLEARILRSLQTKERSLMSRIWPWLLLPPAMAMGILLLRPSYQKPSPIAHVAAPVEVPRPVVVEVGPTPVFMNPLENESLALERDAGRAGRFLIDCLPSFGGLAD